MIYDVIITSEARHDLKMIYEYIANVLMVPIIAEKQFSRIEKAIYSLNHMPERFQQYENEAWRSRNLRAMPVNKYIVFYTVDNENRKTTIIRIMYGARNIEKELTDMVQ